MRSEWVMSLKWIDAADAEGFVGTLPDESLAWYKVIGIEFVLLVGILAPLICGAILAH